MATSFLVQLCDLLGGRFPNFKSEKIAKQSRNVVGFVYRFCFAICWASGLLPLTTFRFAVNDSDAEFVQYQWRQICCFLKTPILDNRGILRYRKEKKLTGDVRAITRNVGIPVPVTAPQ
jgi:hypothetical protein